MLQPKRAKHRKAQKGRIRNVAKRGTTISFGSFALKAVEPIWLNNRQIEAARQAMTRAMKREGNVWIRIFPDKPITKKPAEVRMGKGKGNPEYWAAVVEPGRIIFECDGVTPEVAQNAMKLAAAKLPIATKFVSRRDL
ncbi:50S ribosomal protein L16 [Arachidicoccus soli]|uniref:Large ribosomal subunit protein uL16 n=1 Tax=Arachidicoccus soli TaxID=2341117 RepID=A0A386HTD9_9BACT|nr:50S ribosomal protein L16 [Arachidicoccus soli]AYD48929.1 50S ribosomal protein L16 [Arachidicoccus soli]